MLRCVDKWVFFESRVAYFRIFAPGSFEQFYRAVDDLLFFICENFLSDILDSCTQKLRSVS